MIPIAEHSRRHLALVLTIQHSVQCGPDASAQRAALIAVHDRDRKNYLRQSSVHDEPDPPLAYLIVTSLASGRPQKFYTP